jgi:hypothetical protein
MNPIFIEFIFRATRICKMEKEGYKITCSKIVEQHQFIWMIFFLNVVIHS